MLVRPATASDRAAWDDFALRRCGGVLLGTWGWGELKRRQGWEITRLVAENAGAVEGLLHIQLRRGTGGVGFAYAPRSPVVVSPSAGADAAVALLGAARRHARRRGCLVLKADPEWTQGDAAARAVLASARARDSWYDVQHRKTYLVDLTGGAASIQGRLKESTRRNIRLAGRAGVEVEVRTDPGAAHDFWPLLAESGERAGFVPRHAAYYAEIVEEVGASCPVTVLLARADGELLAGMIAVAAGPRLVYLYGGNRHDRPRHHAPYAVQWRAIEWGLAHGCEVYDMWGVPNHEDPARPGFGYYEFKTRFNGRVARHMRCQDVRLWPGTGPLPELLERLALRGRPLLT
ncbi:MAG TPA: peptidoglycan bridge formation glycyltransferase FemA/FemB family protein [Candidatus Dormibacteraeota bacterium]|nr:peptidoglycan bridge formation glycyltransferase FemA/FemB family protein [Candidatus Dormibacteraeota bacterium]